MALRAFLYDAFDPWINFVRPSSLSTSGIGYPRMDPLAISTCQGVRKVD
jgi:hypothetical protein